MGPESLGSANIRYGWHDRYAIPLDHPSAFPFYADHLVVPHSLREMLWAAIARNFPRAARSKLVAWPLLRDGLFTTQREMKESVTARTVDFLAGALEDHLRRARVEVSGPLALLTLADYQNSQRGQTVIFLFDRASETPLGVAKVTFQSPQRAVLQQEYECLRSLVQQLNEELRTAIPQPLALLNGTGFTVLLETFLPGRSIYWEMRNRWDPRRQAPQHFRLALEWLVRFHAATRTATVHLDADALGEYVQAPLEHYQRIRPPSRLEHRLMAQTIRRGRQLRGTELYLAARHGDFWARNLIRNGRSMGVVDWERFAPQRTPFDDLFLFPTSYGLTFPWKLGGWTNPAAAFRATYLQANDIALLVREYLLQYCRLMGLSPELLEVFFPVFLATRALQEASPTDRPLSPDDGYLPQTRIWQALFQAYADRNEPACFGGSFA